MTSKSKKWSQGQDERGKLIGDVGNLLSEIHGFGKAVVAQMIGRGMCAGDTGRKPELLGRLTGFTHWKVVSKPE